LTVGERCLKCVSSSTANDSAQIGRVKRSTVYRTDVGTFRNGCKLGARLRPRRSLHQTVRNFSDNASLGVNPGALPSLRTPGDASSP